MNIGEMIGGLFILIICTAPVVIIGIVQFNSKNPVGFWSGKEPPKKEQIIEWISASCQAISYVIF